MSEHSQHEPTDHWREVVSEDQRRPEAPYPERRDERIADVTPAMAELPLGGRAGRSDSRTRRDADEPLAVLARVGEAVGNAASLDELLHVASEQAAALADADQSLVLLVDESDTLRIRAQHGVAAAATAAFAAKLTAPDDGRLAARLASVMGGGAQDGVLTVPLLVLGRLTGLLAVGPAHREVAPGARAALLTALASQVAGPLESARLAAEIREHRLLADTAERATGVGVLTWNMITGVRTWSPEVYRLHGLDPGGPASHEAWRATVHPDDLARIMADSPERWTLPRDGASTPAGFREEEYRAVLPDGTVRWIGVRTRIVEDADGRPAALLGVAFDITERKRVEAAIQANEERFRFASGALAGFLYDWDPATNRVERFGGMEEVVGFRLDEVTPDAGWWVSRLHPDDRPQAERAGRAALESDAAGYSLEYRIEHRAGHYIDVADRGRIVRDAAGRAVRVLGGISDISERRRLEREHALLLEREREARAHADEARARAEAERARADAANRAKDEFLARMSHELRTPLNAILGYAQLLDMGLPGPVTAAQRDALARITRAEQHLLTLVNDVLQFAQLEAGQTQLEIADVPLAEVCSRVEEIVGPEAAAKHLGFTCDPTDPAAPPGPPLVARADRDRALQILVNLVTNALKYTNAGGTVALDVAADVEHVAVRVRDTGRGIPADQREVIFHPFVQVEGARASREGVGLGLAISRDLARAMGGDVTVESTVGTGSTFTLTLPRSGVP